MLSNAYFLAKFRFDTAENEPAKNLQKIANFPNFADGVRSNLEGDAGAAPLFFAMVMLADSMRKLWTARGFAKCFRDGAVEELWVEQASFAGSEIVERASSSGFGGGASKKTYVFSNSELERIFSNF